MDFFSTLQDAHDSIKALHKEIDRVEQHARMMAGNSDVVPFEKTAQNRARFGKYNAVAHQLLEDMRRLAHRLPQDGHYKNMLGWAMVFDEISRS